MKNKETKIAKILDWFKRIDGIKVANGDIKYTIRPDGGIHVDPSDLLESQTVKKQLNAS